MEGCPNGVQISIAFARNRAISRALWVMSRVRALSPVVFCLFLSLPCVAQDLVPFFRLSPDETTKAKQIAQSVKDAEERSSKAKIAWEEFHKSYQAAHANLPGLKFTDDLRLAVAQTNSPILRVYQAVSIELTAEERKRLENLRQELVESEQSQKQAQIAWQDFNYQLAADHAGNPAKEAGYNVVTLSSGKQLRLYSPWVGPLAFTADFKIAFPLGVL